MTEIEQWIAEAAEELLKTPCGAKLTMDEAVEKATIYASTSAGLGVIPSMDVESIPVPRYPPKFVADQIDAMWFTELIADEMEKLMALPYAR